MSYFVCVHLPFLRGGSFHFTIAYDSCDAVPQEFIVHPYGTNGEIAGTHVSQVATKAGVCSV